MTEKSNIFSMAMYDAAGDRGNGHNQNDTGDDQNWRCILKGGYAGARIVQIVL